MSTITKEFTKEQLIEKLQHRIAVTANYPDVEEAQLDAAIFKIALASLEAEPVAFINGAREPVLYGAHIGIAIATQLYTAPPAPVSVPDEMTMQEALSAIDRLSWQECTRDAYMIGWNACRAAMLQGADTELQRKAAIHDALCERYNVESLTDFVDWQRNHIAELEAAPPAPVGPGETAVMPDYPGYTMTQRECFQAGKKAGLAEAGNSPVIPDGWVACSQRLPETDGNYWGWWSESKRQGPVWFIKSELQAQFQSSEITHWMPLPAAPQQEAE